MSVLNLFAEMDEKINGVLTELEVINGKLDKITVKLEGVSTLNLTGKAFHEERNAKKENTEEEVSQDLAQVLIFNETGKAYLVLKHGFQVWVAKSHLENAEGYELGSTCDLKVKEKSKWILKKLDWKPFEVFKD